MVSTLTSTPHLHKQLTGKARSKNSFVVFDIETTG